MAATNATTPPLDPKRAQESIGYQLTTAVAVCTSLAAFFTVLRLYTRLVLLRKFFWEDLSIASALLCTVLMGAFNQVAVVYGSGRHIETIDPNDWVEVLKVGVGITQFYSLAHFFLKLSIMLQYVRISVLPSDRRLTHILIAVLCTGYFIFIVMRMARCTPFEAQWNPRLPGARCAYNNTWFLFASQTWNMVMDFAILLVPLFILRHSKAPFMQRVVFFFVLALGGSACIISALRLQTLYPSTTSADPSWDKLPSALYSEIEVNVGISCACVVTLRPLLHQLRQPFSRKAKTAPPRIGPAPPSPVRRRLSADLSLTADTTQIGSEDHDVELGGVGPDHRDPWVADSKPLDPHAKVERPPSPTRK